MIAGVRVRDLERLSPRVLAGVLPRLYPEMLERAYAHQDEGLPVYISTAASQEMADLLARVLAFDGGLGSRSEVVDGRYTGRPAGPFNYREGKVLSMRAVAEREGIDLGASYAYSDSESDLPMLRAVRYAVVVNPDMTLRRIAIEEGWEVVELDRLPRRLKLLAAVGAGTAIATAGRALHTRRARGRERPPRSAGLSRIPRSLPARPRAHRPCGRGAPVSDSAPRLHVLKRFEHPEQDPRRRRQARPRRPRPRREDHRARAARRGHGGDLHGPAPDARADRRDRDPGGRRRRRPLDPLRRAHDARAARRGAAARAGRARTCS